MTEVAGRLMEVSRREIQPTQIYYCAVMEPMQLKAITDLEYSQPLTPKKERWVCHSKPVGDKDFAIFLLEGIE